MWECLPYPETREGRRVRRVTYLDIHPGNSGLLRGAQKYIAHINTQQNSPKFVRVSGSTKSPTPKWMWLRACNIRNYNGPPVFHDLVFVFTIQTGRSVSTTIFLDDIRFMAPAACFRHTRPDLS